MIHIHDWRVGAQICWKGHGGCPSIRRLNMSQLWQKRRPTVSQAALKVVQHSSLSKSRYYPQFWDPLRIKDTRTNWSSVRGPQGRGGRSACPVRRTWVSWTGSAWRRGRFGASNRSPAPMRRHQGDKAGLLGGSESTSKICCRKRGSGWV